MKKTSIAMCAVLFGALVVSNAFASDAETGAAVTTEVNTGTVVEATTTAAETTTGTTEATAEATTGAVEATTGAAETTTGEVATGTVAEATTGDVTTGAVATGAAEVTTGEAEKSINDALHAILDKFFEDNASKFNTAKDKNDCLETVKANINKAAETAKEAQKEAYAIIKEALETYKIK